jgi:TadE-like protein
MRRRRSGQAAVEFALMYAAVILPLTFMIVFVSEMLWVWHSVVDFTRDGANYAITHCWMGDGSNVLSYMSTHVPRMIDMDQFQSGAAGVQVNYFAVDPATGQMSPFTCASGADCSSNCVPDAVTVSVTSYQFTKGLSTLFKLPAVTIPPFATSMPMQSAGCDESGNCLP